MTIYKKEGFEMAKLPAEIQNAILEVQILAARHFKYNANKNFFHLVLQIEFLENHQSILDENFNFENWEQVLEYYFNDQLESCKNKNPYSLLSTV